MAWQLDSYIIILACGAVIAGLVALAAWKRPVAAGGRNLAVLMGAVCAWSLTAAIEASAPSIPLKIIWSKVEYIGIALTPLLLFLFALRFTRSDAWLTTVRRAFVWSIPLLTLGLAITNEWHHLIWTGFSLVAGPRTRLLIYHHGPFFWVHVVYSYALLVVTTALLFRACLRSRDIHRRQAMALLLALPWPYLGNAAYLAGLTAASGHDYTSLGFAVTGAFLLWAIYRLRLVDLVPVARERVIESMHEALIILDGAGRVADLNPAARTLLVDIGATTGRASISKIAGRPVHEAFISWPELAASLGDPASGKKELVCGTGDRARIYDLRLSPLAGRGGNVDGWVAVIYDITRLKQAETRATDALDVVETLRDAGIIMSSTLDFERMSATILDQIRRVITFDAGAFLMVEGSELRLAGIKGILEGRALIGRTFPVAGCRLCNLIIQQGRPQVVEGIGRDDILLPLPPDFDVRSYLGVPIIFHDQVSGLLAIYGRRDRQFTDHDIWVADLFARQVGIAVENARLYDLEKKLAVTDNLTGLLNRRRFFEVAEREFRLAQRHKRSLALILFDIDNFKRVNDIHGHLAGDHVLRVLADMAGRALRTTDFICRFGGEEFIILMPEANRGQALAKAEQLRRQVSEKIIDITGGQVSMTISLGVAGLTDEKDETLEKLISRADAAMYEAKAAGRNAARG